MLILTTFFWGSTFFLVKETVTYIPIDGFLTVRFLIAAVILTPLALRELKHTSIRGVLLPAILLGTLLYISFIFQTIGLTLTTPAKAAFITGINVVLVPIVAITPPFKKKISKTQIGTTVISLTGLALMTLDFNSLMPQIGDMLIVVTAFAVAYHVLFTDRYANLPVYTLVTLQLYVVSLESGVLSLINSTYWIPGTANEPMIVWITLLVTAFFASAFAFVSQTFAQKVGVTPPTIAIIFALEPIFALLIDIIRMVLPTIVVIGGMILILIANAVEINFENKLRSQD